MTYRDENEALRAQLDEAEREIARLNEENRALRTVHPPSTRPSLLAGGPTRIELARDIPGDLSPEDYDAVTDALDPRDGRMHVQRVGRALEIRFGAQEGRDLMLRIFPKDGTTRITVRERHYALLGGLYGGGLGGLGGGGLGLVVPLSVLTTQSPSITISAALAWLLGAFGVARYTYHRIVTRREQEAQRLLATVERAVSEAIAKRRSGEGAPRVRVQAEAAGEVAPSGEDVEGRADTKARAPR